MPADPKSKPSPRKRRVVTRRTSAPPAAASPNAYGASNLREDVTAYRKHLILIAATDAFFEHGYHDCTVDMIAQRLSGSKSIVYYYFPDKHSILEAIYHRALDEAQALMHRAISANGTPSTKLAAIARDYALWVIEHQRVVGIFWREVRSLSVEARDGVAIERKKLDDLLSLVIREGVSKGQFDVTDVQATARAIEGMITFTYTWWRDDRRMSREDAAEHYVRMSLRLVGVRSV